MARTKLTPHQRSGGFASGIITAATLGSTGNKVITGVGFTPKLVLFFDAYDGGSGYGAFGMMMADGNQFAKAWGLRTITSSNVAADSFFLSTRCAISMTISSGGAASLNFEASHVSMDADGFTINVNATSSPNDLQWVAFG